jgi:hypothetical protein
MSSLAPECLCENYHSRAVGLQIIIFQVLQLLSELSANLKLGDLLVVLAFVYTEFNPVTRGILGLASAAGEQWFIVVIKKPWQCSLSGLFYWRYKAKQFVGVAWR